MFPLNPEVLVQVALSSTTVYIYIYIYIFRFKAHKIYLKMSEGHQLENANPVIFQRSGDRMVTASEEDEDVHDPIDDREIFDIL